MTDPTRRTIADWLADLEESEAEAEAGLTVSSEAVRQLFAESLARVAAKKAAAPKSEATSRR